MRRPATALSGRWIVLALLACAAILVFATGLHREIEPEALRALLLESGPWGPIVFVALFVCCTPFAVPGILFLATAIAVWPPWQAFLLNWAGGVGAGIVGFWFARTVGRDWAAARMPERLRSLDARIEQRGLATVIVVRVLFFIAPWAHWGLGLSSVRFGSLLAGSVIGLAPGMAVVTFLGAGALAWLRSQSLGVWVGVVAAVAIGIAAVRRRRRRADVPV